jgi:colanic acid/amylovoran biosynthesis glycosyltransferase
VHAHYATYPALAAWVCHRFTGVPYSFTAHAHDLYVDSSMLARKVADAAEVVTISGYNRDLLEALGTRTPITIVPCGIDVASYPFRTRPIPTSGPVRALCVASLQEYKGHRVLLDALAARPELAELELDLIGDGVLREELRDRARELDIADRVHFLGPRTESEVRDALARADVFVLPSIVAADGQTEGLPVALMEALACGVPAVSTTLSGIPEIIRPGVTGLLAAPGDPQALADALVSTLADPDAAAVRSRAGRELVEREFDATSTVASLADVLTRGPLAVAG